MIRELSEQQKEDFIVLLEKIGAVRDCPRCGHDKFILFQQYNDYTHRAFPPGRPGEPPFIPSIYTICGKCGFVSQHALQILDDYQK